MNRTPALRLFGVGALMALALTGCGSSIGAQMASARSAANAPTLPSTSSAADREVEANAEADANAAAEAEAAAAATPTPATNARGNIVKGLGEEGGLYSEDDTALYTFAIDAITPDISCTEPYASGTENGHLTAVQMRVSTGAVGFDELGYVSVSGYDFTFIGSNGLTFTNVQTVGTYGCIDPNTEFPSDQLRPGSQYAGSIVLDLPEASGTLIYAPSYSYGSGWEISY